MPQGIFDEREHAIEAGYFRQQDARLLDVLRRGGNLDDIAAAMAELLAVDNEDLLHRARALGITAETATALLAAPLVEAAWARGSVTRRRREAVVRLATARGMAATSLAHHQLLAWLDVRPPDALFETALEIIAYGLARMPPLERSRRAAQIVDACREVMNAPLSLSRLLGLTRALSRNEAATLSRITKALERDPAPTRQ